MGSVGDEGEEEPKEGNAEGGGGGAGDEESGGDGGEESGGGGGEESGSGGGEESGRGGGIGEDLLALVIADAIELRIKVVVVGTVPERPLTLLEASTVVALGKFLSVV